MKTIKEDMLRSQGTQMILEVRKVLNKRAQTDIINFKALKETQNFTGLRSILIPQHLTESPKMKRLTLKQNCLQLEELWDC